MMSKVRSSESRRAADLAYQWIRDQILSGQHAQGDWLRESDLAAAIGVSRTPVREALLRLGAEGLVRHERHRGAQVQGCSAKDLDEVFSLRAVLEPWGCRLAATVSGRGTDGAADVLATLADAMETAASRRRPDLDAITDLDSKFHLAILDQSGNARLVTFVSSLVHVPMAWRAYSYYSTEALWRSLGQHHDLVDALRAGDPDWAESVMRAHVLATWWFIRTQMQKSTSSLS
jgi:DNA-binding GntR family transcriptional regulator